MISSAIVVSRFSSLENSKGSFEVIRIDASMIAYSNRQCPRHPETVCALPGLVSAKGEKPQGFDTCRSDPVPASREFYATAMLSVKPRCKGAAVEGAEVEREGLRARSIPTLDPRPKGGGLGARSIHRRGDDFFAEKPASMREIRYHCDFARHSILSMTDFGPFRLDFRLDFR